MNTPQSNTDLLMEEHWFLTHHLSWCPRERLILNVERMDTDTLEIGTELGWRILLLDKWGARIHELRQPEAHLRREFAWYNPLRYLPRLTLCEFLGEAFASLEEKLDEVEYVLAIHELPPPLLSKDPEEGMVIATLYKTPKGFENMGRWYRERSRLRTKPFVKVPAENDPEAA